MENVSKLKNIDKLTRAEAVIFAMYSIIMQCISLMEDCGVNKDDENYNLDHEYSQLIFTLLCKASEVSIDD